MRKPHLWIIAGPNGAGKTTFVNDGPFRAALSHCEFINPDALTLAYLKDQGFTSWSDTPEDILKATFIRAAEDCQKQLERGIETGGSVVIETVLSTAKYKTLVERVKLLKGRFMLLYVALNSPLLSKERIAFRVSQNGHGVPAEKLTSRWSKSLTNLAWFANQADRFWVIDNSSEELHENYHLIISGHTHHLTMHGLPRGPMMPVASQIVTNHSRCGASGEWSFTISDNPPLFLPS